MLFVQCILLVALGLGAKTAQSHYDAPASTASPGISRSEQDHSTYILSFSGYFANGRGWAAFGAGSVMDHALMFVMYPNEREENLTMSVRSTSGHNPPRKVAAPTNVTILRNTIEAANYYRIDFTFDSRLYPPGNEELSENGSIESWIWSANDYQKLESTEDDADLQMHLAYGRFQVLLASSSPDEVMLSNHSRSSINAWEPETLHNSRAVFKLHGVLMTVAFLILYPIGVLGMRHGKAQAFPLHSSAQCMASAAVLVAAALAAFHFGQKLSAKAAIVHAGVGVAVVALITFQGTTGLIHHRKFIRTGEKTSLGRHHRFVGYVTCLIGQLNFGLGLMSSGKSDTLTWPIALCVAVSIGWVGLGRYIKHLSKEVAHEGDTDEPLMSEI